ncbi:hypothetical protein [uncultured Deefgea sp.]|uniref:hypothetical protein n=1 Tax=uncultured Deefgea sp. TaxID=1304914 RepID=UPI00259ABCF7|nr:hypothetical protein [uncultured Deefgea sp.]
MSKSNQSAAPVWRFSPNFKAKDSTKVKPPIDPEMEARKQARYAVEDLNFERQQREVWEQGI